MTHRAWPGLYFARGTSSSASRDAVRAMLAASGRPAGQVAAACGKDWAVVVVGPPATEPTCGAAVVSIGKDVLALAGEVFLPSGWGRASDHSHLRAAACVVLQQLHARGVAALAEVDGAFCGAWFDATTDRWTLFNDRWGLVPLFWWSAGPRIIAAPRAGLVLAGSGVHCAVNPDGLADLVRTQNMLDDHTLYAGVRWLEPACGLEHRSNGPRLRVYWHFEQQPIERSSAAVVETLAAAERETLLRLSDCDGELMLGISGGLDSRLFLALCDELKRPPVCYTAGRGSSEDVRFGRMLARAAGTEHRALPLDESCLDWLGELVEATDGLHSAGHLLFSTPIVPHLAGTRGAVVLEGYLHGVLGGSDVPFDEDAGSGLPPHSHRWAREFLHSGGDVPEINGLLVPELAGESIDRWSARIDGAWAHAGTDSPLDRAEHVIINGRSGRNDVLAPAMLGREALVRQPACHSAMLAWYASTPAAIRRARRPYIDLLVTEFPRFARVPRADGCGALPLAGGMLWRNWCWQRDKLARWVQGRRDDVVARFGRGSMALRCWAADRLAASGALAVLGEPAARIRDYVRPEALARLIAVPRQPSAAVTLMGLLTAEWALRAGEHATKRAPAAFQELEFADLTYRGRRAASTRSGCSATEANRASAVGGPLCRRGRLGDHVLAGPLAPAVRRRWVRAPGRGRLARQSRVLRRHAAGLP